MPRASAPLPRSCSTTGAMASALRPVTQTPAPRAARAAATARPVTTARRPVRSNGSGDDMAVLPLVRSAPVGVDPGQRPLLARLRVGQHDLDVVALLLDDERPGGGPGVGAGLALVIEVHLGLAA